MISTLGYFGMDPKDVSLAGVSSPSLIPTRGTVLGSLKLDAFLPTPISTDDECNVIDAFKARPGLEASHWMDAFLYLGPATSHLREKIPADVGAAAAYLSELLRRNQIIGLPGPQSVTEFNRQLIASAGDVVLTTEKLPDAQQFYPMIRNLCLEAKKNAK